MIFSCAYSLKGKQQQQKKMNQLFKEKFEMING